MDACDNTANGSSTSGKNLVNFGPTTHEFCRRICARRSTVYDLPRISCATAALDGGKINTGPRKDVVAESNGDHCNIYLIFLFNFHLFIYYTRR